MERFNIEEQIKSKQEGRDKIEELLKKCLDSKDTAVRLMSLIDVADSFYKDKNKDKLSGIVKSSEDIYQEWCADKGEAEKCARIYISIIEKWDNRLDETAKYCQNKRKEMESDFFDSLRRNFE